MSDTQAIKKLMAQAFGEMPAPSGPRLFPCSRCSHLVEEYRKHDPSWTPPEAMSWVTPSGLVVHGANCESCNWIEFEQRIAARIKEIGDPQELGVRATERENRGAALGALNRARQHYIEARRVREERVRRFGAAPRALTQAPHWTEKAEAQRELSEAEREARRAQSMADLQAHFPESEFTAGLGLEP